ncbi:1-phosphofructokinase family hexose kinase [Herbiconiux flava]|uniref:1-phosphofructokinase n=1 Tax=Herbiconiux flava TaxID=881268 RepID=A0A852SQ38_9MICO|nr:PfkB family carbohydrate kinase [Herbiconiux flava]NYD70905.1 1-phosphofructokinase [Herbiconiux flava]GLK19133.1 1-phosphofructokinase [Herbiconiux flava]
MSGDAIVTVTPAPAIDLTYRVGRLDLGEVNRAEAVHTELSGKGVNVARAVALSELQVSAVLALSAQGTELARDAGFAGLLAGVPDEGRTRINTTLLDASGTTTKINEGAPPVSAELWAAIADRAESELRRLDAGWLVVSGSIPLLAGTAQMVPFLDLVRRAADTGVRVAVDTAGPALSAVVADLSAVTLIKPNTHELAELTGSALRTVGDVVAAARTLHEAGCDVVYVSMGADGALAVSASGVQLARARARVVNTAGAGDASLAGFLVGSAGPGGTLDAASGVYLAASWGALAVTQATTLLSSVEAAPRATLVHDPDPATPLSEPATP